MILIIFMYPIYGKINKQLNFFFFPSSLFYVNDCIFIFFIYLMKSICHFLVYNFVMIVFQHVLPTCMYVCQSLLIACTGRCFVFCFFIAKPPPLFCSFFFYGPMKCFIFRNIQIIACCFLEFS